MYRRDDFDESFTSAANVDDGIAWQWVQVGKRTEERSLLVAAMVKMATVTRIMKYNKYDEDQDDYGAEVQDDHVTMVDHGCSPENVVEVLNARTNDIHSSCFQRPRSVRCLGLKSFVTICDLFKTF